MYKKTIFLLSLCLFIKCQYFRGDNCNNTRSIIGTYENLYDKKAKNVLIINADGTFNQKFIKDGITKESTGSWKFYNESCKLKLANHKLMHELGIYERELFTQKGKYRLNKIIFVEDLPKEFDFFRVE